MKTCWGPAGSQLQQSVKAIDILDCAIQISSWISAFLEALPYLQPGVQQRSVPV